MPTITPLNFRLKEASLFSKIIDGKDAKYRSHHQVYAEFLGRIRSSEKNLSSQFNILVAYFFPNVSDITERACRDFFTKVESLLKDEGITSKVSDLERASPIELVAFRKFYFPNPTIEYSSAAVEQDLFLAKFQRQLLLENLDISISENPIINYTATQIAAISTKAELPPFEAFKKLVEDTKALPPLSRDKRIIQHFNAGEKDRAPIVYDMQALACMVMPYLSPIDSPYTSLTECLRNELCFLAFEIFSNQLFKSEITTSESFLRCFSRYLSGLNGERISLFQGFPDPSSFYALAISIAPSALKEGIEIKSIEEPRAAHLSDSVNKKVSDVLVKDNVLSFKESFQHMCEAEVLPIIDRLSRYKADHGRLKALLSKIESKSLFLDSAQREILRNRISTLVQQTLSISEPVSLSISDLQSLMSAKKIKKGIKTILKSFSEKISDPEEKASFLQSAEKQKALFDAIQQEIITLADSLDERNERVISFFNEVLANLPVESAEKLFFETFSEGDFKRAVICFSNAASEKDGALSIYGSGLFKSTEDAIKRIFFNAFSLLGGKEKADPRSMRYKTVSDLNKSILESAKDKDYYSTERFGSFLGVFQQLKAAQSLLYDIAHLSERSLSPSFPELLSGSLLSSDKKLLLSQPFRSEASDKVQFSLLKDVLLNRTPISRASAFNDRIREAWELTASALCDDYQWTPEDIQAFLDNNSFMIGMAELSIGGQRFSIHALSGEPEKRIKGDFQLKQVKKIFQENLNALDTKSTAFFLQANHADINISSYKLEGNARPFFALLYYALEKMSNYSLLQPSRPSSPLEETDSVEPTSVITIEDEEDEDLDEANTSILDGLDDEDDDDDDDNDDFILASLDSPEETAVLSSIRELDIGMLYEVLSAEAIFSIQPATSKLDRLTKFSCQFIRDFDRGLVIAITVPPSTAPSETQDIVRLSQAYQESNLLGNRTVRFALLAEAPLMNYQQVIMLLTNISPFQSLVALDSENPRTHMLYTHDLDLHPLGTNHLSRQCAEFPLFSFIYAMRTLLPGATEIVSQFNTLLLPSANSKFGLAPHPDMSPPCAEGCRPLWPVHALLDKLSRQPFNHALLSLLTLNQEVPEAMAILDAPHPQKGMLATHIAEIHNNIRAVALLPNSPTLDHPLVKRLLIACRKVELRRLQSDILSPLSRLASINSVCADDPRDWSSPSDEEEQHGYESAPSSPPPLALLAEKDSGYFPQFDAKKSVSSTTQPKEDAASDSDHLMLKQSKAL